MYTSSAIFMSESVQKILCVIKASLTSMNITMVKPLIKCI